MNSYLENIKLFLGRLSMGQKVAIGVVLVGSIAVFSGIAYWAGQPDYALLFGNLGSNDANKVVEALAADGVKYELRDAGTAIYVPRERRDELRLRFAGEGVVSEGPLGYELFDRGTLGMTDFMQKLNLRRALEGELARTISNIRQVEIARVHLNMPERSPFRETQEEPTASVVVQLSSSARLSPQQVQGITALVAGAVEGLVPSEVTVLDTRGNMLSDPEAGDEEAHISSNQLRHQRAIEDMLTKKGQSMLDQIVGPSNAIVRVNAAVDFTRSVAERNLIDPESATVIAEERQDTQEDADRSNASIRNYELSRTIERTEKSVGDISYMTVSVILNARPIENPDDEQGAPVQYATYTDAELQEIEALVKNAVGFNEDRGDRFAIHQTRFDTTVDERVSDEIAQQQRHQQYQIYLRYALMLIALGAAVWLLRSASRRLGEAREEPVLLGQPLQARSLAPGAKKRGVKLPGDADPQKLEAHEEEDDEEYVMVDDVFTSKLSPEARARLKAKHLMFEEIKSTVNEKPEQTADLLRSWMMEDKVDA